MSERSNAFRVANATFSEPSAHYTPARFWSASGGLIIAPALATVAIPMAFESLSETIPGLLDPGLCCFSFPLERALWIVVTVALCAALLAIVYWQYGAAFRLIRSDAVNRRTALALTGVGLLSASYVAFFLPALLTQGIPTLTLAIWSDWIPAFVLAGSALVLIGARLSPFAAMIGFAPMVPLIAVSVHENTWVPHSYQCPTVWVLPLVQAPWVTAGLATALAILFAVWATREHQQGELLRASRVAVVVALTLIVGYLCIYGLNADWYRGDYEALAITFGGAAVLAGIVFAGGAWAWRAVRASPISTLTMLSVVGAMVLASWLPTAMHQEGPTDCQWYANVHHLIGQFYW